MRKSLSLVVPLLLCAGWASAQESRELESLKAMEARFTPVDLAVDVSALPENERAALTKLVAAARVMDALFLRQTWAGNESMLLDLLKDPTPLGQARLRAFLIYKGPWDRQDHNKPFIPAAPPKPAEANFYPAGSTKEEIERWISGLSEPQKSQATGFFTTLRRGMDGKFLIVPYSVDYQNELKQAADLLRDAARLTKQPSLKNYLEKRADAFLSNDYYDSDVAWMELDASIEPTIGPYENYEDEWFNYKAAFEAFIALRDGPETEKLRKFAAELQGLEDRLPVEAGYRNPKLGAMAPIRVVNQVYASGDADHGVKTAAFNLPNDERVTREKGSKRVMLKNVQEAKFKGVLLPITRVALAPADQGKVDFDAFFTHILMHELMHGLGPHDIKNPDGSMTAVRKALKETSSALEEAKADISGLWALQQLIDKGVLDKSMEKTMYATFLASSFRTLRFGVSEAHGKGMALQLNYLLDQGGFTVAKDGTFSVVDGKIKSGVEALTREIMTIQAKGDYAAARKMLDSLGVLRPSARRIIDRLQDVPIDIAPRAVAFN